jgi:GUN4-like
MQRFVQFLIKWLPVGIGGFSTISFLIANQWTPAIVLAVGTLCVVVVNQSRNKFRKDEQLQIPPQYALLASYLAAGEWKKADEETTKLLMEGEQNSFYSAVWANLPSSFPASEIFAIPAHGISQYCKSIPCEKILMIDQLWVHFSGGWFGLSVQNRVAWESGIKDVNSFELLAERLGWKENNYWIYYEDLTFDIKAPMGHLPVEYFFLADQGHGFLPREHESGKREAVFVVFGPALWLALVSRLNVCIQGETSEAPPEQQLSSSVNQLETYLINRQWRQADQETHHIIIQILGRGSIELFDEEWLKDFPCEYLSIIDQLWVKYSNGKFGFSVQKQIWQECGSPVVYDDNWNRFKNRVGWRLNENHIFYNDVVFHISAPKGHLPCWAGWARLGNGMERFVGSDGAFSVIFNLTENCGL